MASIDEVARVAGVSIATVSRALNGRGDVSSRTRERVIRAANHLGYVPSASASGLATGKMWNVGVLLSLPDRWFFSTVVAAISNRLLGHGYDITLYNLTDDPAQRRTIFERSLRRGRIDALIVLSAWLTPDEQAELLTLPLPLVAVGQHPQLQALTIDDYAVGRLATEHLLSLGHRRIAHIGWTEDRQFHMPTLRHNGWEDALRDAGVSPSDELFVEADFTLEGGRRAARELFGRPGLNPTAIFAASDEMAVGALEAVRELGLDVPRDISIVGVDGHELSAFLDLTTIDQFPRRQGERAAEAALLKMGGVEPEQPRALAFELVVRSSTAAPVDVIQGD